MNSLLFLFGVLSIAVVVWWTIRNDKVRADEPTSGLLAMPPEPPASPPSTRRTTRP